MIGKTRPSHGSGVVALLLENIQDPSALADFLAANINIASEKKK